MEALFGGSSQTSTPTNVTPPETAALRKNWTSTLGNWYQTGGPSASGPFAAPITGAEQTGLAGVQSAAFNQPRQDLLNQTLSGNFLPGMPGQNPYFDAAVRQAQLPTLQGLTETLDRTLPGRFTAGGHFVQPGGSSAFDRAAASATTGAANAMAGIATNMGNQLYSQERQLQQQAVGLGQNEVQTFVQNLQAQALPRLIDQMGIEAGLQEFQRQTNALLQALQIATGASGLNQVAQTQTSESQQGLIPGIGSFLGNVYGPRTGTARA